MDDQERLAPIAGDIACDALREELIQYALTFPEAWLDFPWDEPCVKVRNKIFAFLGRHEDECVRLGVKLPETSEAILQKPWAEPSSHGLGRHGWASLRFGSPDDVPPELLEELIVESYLAVAPKVLAKQLAESLATGE